MGKFFDYLRTRPLAFASFCVLAFLYFVMIFADFFAPYPATLTFEENTFHPANVQFSSKGILVREYRAVNKSSWRYVRVKDDEYIHRMRFFVRGGEYRIFGLVPCDVHLFGSDSDYPVYLLGADNLGRDLFSRIVYGSRISLTIGFVATFVSLFLAVLLGGISGYFGGKTDWTIMRFAEFFMLIPTMYFILFLRSLLNSQMDSGTSYMVITIILALVGWPGSARTIRGMVHSIKREEFVLDASLEGVPSLVVIFRHIIPQVSSLLIVSTALSIPGFIMSETTLSYLGLGISDPSVSWGSLINRDISTVSNLKNFPWLLYPVLLLLAVTLSFNFIADAMRDFFDPYNSVFKKKRKFFRAERNVLGTEKALFGTEGKFVKAENKPENPERNISGTERKPEIPEKDIILSVRNLHVTFEILRGTKRAMMYATRGISFDLKKGEVLGIVGESGSGKSVSTAAIPGLTGANSYVEGSIIYGGKDLAKLSQKELRSYRGKEIALVFQEPGRSFDPLQTIGNVFLEAFRNSDSSITKEEAARKTVRLLNEVGLPDAEGRLKSYPHQFSGGQLQRIGIALSLAQDCKVLIADEPTTALDVTIQAQIVSLLLRLKEERGLSVIFISHDINLVAEISDRICVMYGGKIVEISSSDRIIENPSHPYTKALIKSLPRFGFHYTDSKMYSIPGRVQNPESIFKGCPFSPRCEYAKEECRLSDSECYMMK